LIRDRFATRRIKWLAVERRAAAIAGAGVALIDMAYLATPVAEGRLKKLAECPLRLQTGYYFVHLPNGRNLHLLKLLRDWAVETAGPFRSERE
jgi:DNA-binding transcriptional LysR family regulator